MKIAILVAIGLLILLLVILAIIGGMILLLRLVFYIKYGKPPQKPSEGVNFDDLDLDGREDYYRNKWEQRGWKSPLNKPKGRKRPSYTL